MLVQWKFIRSREVVQIMRVKKARFRWRSIVAVILILSLIGYVISYLPRRAMGSYRLTQSGEVRLNFGWAISDLKQWSPEGCWWQGRFFSIKGKIKTRGNNWGYFYAPLIAIDRKLNFPDEVFLTQEGIKEGEIFSSLIEQ